MLATMVAATLTVLATLAMLGALTYILGFVFSVPFALVAAKHRHDEIVDAMSHHMPVPHM